MANDDFQVDLLSGRASFILISAIREQVHPNEQLKIISFLLVFMCIIALSEQCIFGLRFDPSSLVQRHASPNPKNKLSSKVAERKYRETSRKSRIDLSDSADAIEANRGASQPSDVAARKTP